MADIRDLLDRLAAGEKALRAHRFLAPCVRGGSVRAQVAGLLYTFTPRPREFKGWAIFQPTSEREAQVVEEADFVRVAEYLSMFPALRLRLAYKLPAGTWLAYPANESDMRQRFPSREVRPVPVHLVTDGQEFEQVVARSLGGGWWFEELDRRASPLDADEMRAAFSNRLAPESLSWKGLTPEMRSCYSLVYRRDELAREEKIRRERNERGAQEERRLREALRFGGGDLHGFRDRGEFWVVQWTARDGTHHTSAIAKSDLTVISAGICLSGEDDKFDLQSLVGVIEQGWY
jgi:hypothetical protein